jgi:hypothetical protein
MGFWKKIFHLENDSSNVSDIKNKSKKNYKKCHKKCHKKECHKSSSSKSSSSKSSSHSDKCPNLIKIVKPEIYKFRLAINTLPYSGCIEIPALIKNYFNKVGYCNIKKIVESVPILNDNDPPVLDRQYAINLHFMPVSSFHYKNRIYNIRLSLFFSTGVLFYDSLLYNEYGSGFFRLLTLAKFPEVERSTETRWSSMQRTITSEFADIAEGTWQFFAFWMPLVKITEITSDNKLGAVNREVVCIRFGILVDSNGKPIPVVF